MHHSRLAAGLVALTLLSAPAMAAPTVFFGEDLAVASAANMTNSFAARSSFLSHLSGYGVEGFESFAAGSTFPTSNPLTFSGAGVTATNTGGGVRNDEFNGRFAVEGANYLTSNANLRITFSAAVAAFGLFVTDANEVDNNPALVTVGGSTLTADQIAARPFRSVDGIFRIVTERSAGVFELLYDGSGSTFPRGMTGMFVGLLDYANPFTNIILINGASGLDTAFADGFGYDSLIAATSRQVIPTPATALLVATGLLGLVGVRRRSAIASALRA